VKQSSFEDKMSSASQKKKKKFSAFYEPGSSLLHLEEPAICPYPEPDQSSFCPPPTFFKNNPPLLVSRLARINLGESKRF